MARSPAFSDALNPAASLRSSRWWRAAALLAGAIGAAAYASSLVAVSGTPVSPTYLPLGIGAAVLAVAGRSLWPAFLLGDAIGMAVVADRGTTVAVISIGFHIAVVLIGATLIRRWQAWLVDLGSVGRYLVIAVGLSLLGALTGLIIFAVEQITPGRFGLFGEFLTWMMGDLSGYVIAGALILAWSDGARARAACRRPVALGLALIAAIAIWMLVQPSPLGATIALIALGVLAMRLGVLPATVAGALLLGVLLTNSMRGYATFGGLTIAGHAFFSTLAVVIAASAALLLAGYHEAPGSRRPAARFVTLVLAGAIVTAGFATFASSGLMAGRGYPIATASLFSFASAAALAMVRGARVPDPRMSRSGLRIAIVAGVFSALSLVLYYASLPHLGVGAGTALSMTAPGFVVAIVALSTRTLPAPLVLVGAAVITVGAALIAYDSGLGDVIGLTLAVLGGLAFALFIVVLSRGMRVASATELGLVVTLCSGTVTAVVAVLQEGGEAFSLSPTALAVIAFGAIGGNALPMLARAWSLPAIGAPVVGALGVLGPVTTVVLAMVLLGTERSALDVVGIVAIATGAMVTALAPLRTSGAEV